MGQPITVTEKRTSRPDVVRFELNRSLTGMGHEHYDEAPEALLDRPPDRVARLLFGFAGVEHVHVYSNEVTVDLAPGAGTGGMQAAIEALFIHYREGVTPTIV